MSSRHAIFFRRQWRLDVRGSVDTALHVDEFLEFLKIRIAEREKGELLRSRIMSDVDVAAAEACQQVENQELGSYLRRRRDTRLAPAKL